MAHQTEPPLCKCHGEPMVLCGHWKCRVKRQATQARYNASEKGRASRARRNARYDASEKGRARNARYDASEKGQAANRARRDRFWASEKGRQLRDADDRRRRTARIEHKREQVEYLEAQIAAFIESYKEQCAQEV